MGIKHNEQMMYNWRHRSMEDFFYSAEWQRLMEVVGGGEPSKFGVSGEDDTGAEVRLFETNEDFTIDRSYDYDTGEGIIPYNSVLTLIAQSARLEQYENDILISSVQANYDGVLLASDATSGVSVRSNASFAVANNDGTKLGLSINAGGGVYFIGDCAGNMGGARMEIHSNPLDPESTFISINTPDLRVDSISTFADFADDAAAALGGIDVGQFYRTGSFIKMRVA